MINIFLDKNILTYINYIFIIFVMVLTQLAYEHLIFAFDGANNKFQYGLIETIAQNNKSIIINYPSSNITNLTNNNEDSIYGQIAAFENNVYVVWQESVTETLPEHNYDIFFTKSKDNGATFSKVINLSNNSRNSDNPEISSFNENVYMIWQESDQNIT